MKFELVPDWLAILKKNRGWLWANTEGGFFMFSGTKKYLIWNFFKNIASALKWRWEKQKKNLERFSYKSNMQNIHNQLCISLLKIYLPAQLLYNDFGNRGGHSKISGFQRLFVCKHRASNKYCYNFVHYRVKFSSERVLRQQHICV